MFPITAKITTPTAAASNGICQSQTPGGAGNLTLNGSLTSGGVATLATGMMERQVLFTFAADEAARTYTVYGTNGQGNSISETVAGTATTAVTVNYYKTVTRITTDGSNAGAMTVGTNGICASAPLAMDTSLNPGNFSLQLGPFTGTINVTVQYTLQSVFDTAAYGALIWNSVSSLTSRAANTDGTVAFPVVAFRLVTNSFTDSSTACTLTVIQSDNYQ